MICATRDHDRSDLRGQIWRSDALICESAITQTEELDTFRDRAYDGFMNNTNNTATKNNTEARACEGCGRPEHVKAWVSGPPRCASCDLLCDEAIRSGFSCNDVAANFPATVGIGSDSYAATVTDVKRDADGEIKSVTVRRESCEDDVTTFTRRTRGNFKVKGSKRGSGYYLTLGMRKTYLDPSF